MKGLITYLTLFCCFFSQSLFSQQISVSNAVKLNNKVPSFKVLGKTGDYFLIQRKGNKHFLLDVYNNKLKLVQSKSIDLHKNETIETFWLQPQQGFLFSWKHEKDFSILQSQQMDDKIKIANKKIPLDTIYESRDLILQNVRFEYSLNETKLLVYMPLFDNGKVKQFYIHLFNQNAKSIFKTTSTTSSLVDKTFVDALVFNSGAFVIITKEKEDDIFYIHYFNENGQLSVNQYIPVKELYKKLKFELDQNNQSLLISGFYQYPPANKKDNTGAYEFFTSAIDLDSYQLRFSEIVPIDFDFYLLLTGKQSELNPPQLFTFYVKDIVPKSDGGALIICESYFKNEEADMTSTFFSISGMPTYNYSTYYNFNDLIIYDFNANGGLLSQSILRKKQVSQNDNGIFSSYLLVNLQNQLQFLYLDDIRNSSQLLEANLSEDAILKSNTLINLNNFDVFPVVGNAIQTARNEVILPSYQKNKMKIIKIIFE